MYMFLIFCNGVQKSSSVYPTLLNFMCRNYVLLHLENQENELKEVKTKLYGLQSWTKYFEKNREIEQNWTRSSFACSLTAVAKV